jgi:hypothetical protein
VANLVFSVPYPALERSEGWWLWQRNSLTCNFQRDTIAIAMIEKQIS